MQLLISGVLRNYIRWISPLFPPSCRFYPTCSQYALEAIVSKGVFHGGTLALLRVLRCNPLSKGGLDPLDAKHQCKSVHR